MGYGPLRRRLRKQASLWEKDTHQGSGIFRLNSLVKIEHLAGIVLSLTGLRRVARRNYLDLVVEEVEHPLPGLPHSFDGFRILQLSDLHTDLCPNLVDAIRERHEGLEYDAAVLTGDYQDQIAESHNESMELLTRVVEVLKGPKYAILGNHDFIEKVPFLEYLGLSVLLNEAQAVEIGGERLWFAGVDDPHYFQTDDLVRTLSHIPDGEPSVLLSHSPEPYREAERLGFRLLLCGHTHGGQICLPGGAPILKNARVPRRLLSGLWSYGALRGYTSRGTGGCGIAARFFCQPEITVHTLKATATTSDPS